MWPRLCLLYSVCALCRGTDRAQIFERLWSLGIDFKEPIPPVYVARRAGTIILPIPTRLLAPIECLKIPAQVKYIMSQFGKGKGGGGDRFLFTF